MLEHPSFISDPFGALKAHLNSTVDAQQEKAKEERDVRVERNGGLQAAGKGAGPGGTGSKKRSFGKRDRGIGKPLQPQRSRPKSGRR